MVQFTKISNYSFGLRNLRARVLGFESWLPSLPRHMTLSRLQKILFIYSWEIQRERERGRDTGRGRSWLHAGSPTWDWVPGLQKHALGWRQMLKLLSHPGIPLFIYLFIRFYLFIHERYREREREAETQAEGEAGSMQGAACGTWSWYSRITPSAEGGAKPLSHLGCPIYCF